MGLIDDMEKVELDAYDCYRCGSTFFVIQDTQVMCCPHCKYKNIAKSITFVKILPAIFKMKKVE